MSTLDLPIKLPRHYAICKKPKCIFCELGIPRKVLVVNIQNDEIISFKLSEEDFDRFIKNKED